MKTIRRVLLAALIILCLSACGQKNAAPTWQEQYDLGIRYLSEGNYEEAIIAFTAAIEIDPKNADAYLALADVYTAQGNTDAARDILNQALGAVGENADISAALEALTPAELQPLEGYPKTERFDMDTGGYIQTDYNEFGLPTHEIIYNADGSIQNEVSWDYDETGKLLRKSRSQYDSDFDVISVEDYDEKQRLLSVSQEWIEHGDTDGSGRDDSRLESHSYTYLDDTTVNIQVTLTYRTGETVQRVMTHSLGSGSRYAQVMGLHWSWDGTQPVDLCIDHIAEFAAPNDCIRDLQYEEGVLVSSKERDF